MNKKWTLPKGANAEVWEEIQEEYEFNAYFIITSPGWLEGQNVLTPFFYRIVLNGFEDEIITDEFGQAISAFELAFWRDQIPPEVIAKLNLTEVDWFLVQGDDQHINGWTTSYEDFNRGKQAIKESLSYTEDWPRAPGLYWFWGWRFNHRRQPKFFLVEVKTDFLGRPTYIEGGAYMRPEHSRGLFYPIPVQTPVPPAHRLQEEHNILNSILKS